MPWIFYKYKQDDYFKKFRSSANEQIEKGRLVDEDMNKDPYLRIINSSKNQNYKKFEQYYNRAVLSLKIDKEGVELIENCDLDWVELNSLRVDFLDTVNFYAESFIEFGYISMFAAAFPIGPMIAIFADVLELRWSLIFRLEQRTLNFSFFRWKIYSFLYVLKRPLSEKCAGLGTWLNVWELLSLLSVVKIIVFVFTLMRRGTSL